MYTYTKIFMSGPFVLLLFILISHKAVLEHNMLYMKQGECKEYLYLPHTEEYWSGFKPSENLMQ